MPCPSCGVWCCRRWHHHHPCTSLLDTGLTKHGNLFGTNMHLCPYNMHIEYLVTSQHTHLLGMYQ